MARVLVMIPSGEVYGRDNVRWYQHRNIQGGINNYHNIGDAFVYDSSLKLLSCDKLGILEISDFKPNDVDRLRDEYDYVVLRGSNYIHNSMNWEQAVPILRRLGLPIIGFGIGAQAPSMGRIRLSEQTQELLHLMSDSTTSIGVRGAYTAQVLWDIGIRNTRIVGCPTAFRRNDPELRITLPPLDSVRRVGVTIRREVSPDYATDIQEYLTVHRDLVKAMSRRFDAMLMAQGEVEEKKLVLGTEGQRDEAMDALRGNPWAASWYLDEEMVQLYCNRLFYSDVVADYEDLVRSMDLVLGFRLHGNLMALANGIPSVFFTYDSRTVEFAETFRIPSFNVFSQREFVLDHYWKQSLFDKYNRGWRLVYGEMQRFLTENGVAHRMTDPGEFQSNSIRKIA